MKRAWMILAILPLLTGCFSVSPVAKMEPTDNDFKWDHGQKLLEKTSHGITVSLAYNTNTTEYLIFDVEITNESKQEILVAPESFFYSCRNQYGTELGKKQYALNPEHQLLRIDKALSKTDARQSNQALLSLISTTAEATALIASLDESSHTQFRLASELARNSYYRNIVKEATNEDNKTLQQQRNYWANNALRKTTLKPDYYIGGKVYFPRNDHAANCIFTFPLADTQIAFEYQQHLIAH